MAAAALSTDRGSVSSFIPPRKAPAIKPEDDVLTLPFVRDTSRDEQRSGTPRRLFWDVSPCGDHVEDMKTGELYARSAMSFMAKTKTSYIIQWAVRDMMRLDRPFSGIEIGFLGEITKCANIAHRVALSSRERRAVLS